ARQLLTAGSGRDEVHSALALGPLHLAGVEALKAKKTPKPQITATVTAGPTSSGSVTVSGKTFAKAKVTLDIGANGSIDQTVKASKSGLYTFTFNVGFASTS